MTLTSNFLGLDVGERRIGVAMASVQSKLPAPLLTIDRQKNPKVFDAIADLVKLHNVQAIVLGLPRGMDGQETLQTESIRNFESELSKNCDVPIHLQDEAATSIVAEEELKLKGAYEKGDIDKLAAAIILSDWLANNEIGVTQ